MKIRQLDIIKLLYQEQNVRKVSEIAEISPEDVDGILGEIEDRLEEPGFEREGDSLTLTAKGEDFFKFLEALPDSNKSKKKSKPSKKSEKDRYASVFQNFGDPITITEIDGTIIDCNQAALEVFEITKEKFLGRNNYVDGLAASEVDIERKNSRIEENLKQEGRYRFVAPISKSGTVQHWEVIVLPFEDKVLGHEARIWYGRDISQHIQLEEQLQVGLMEADLTRQQVEDEGADLVAMADDLAVARDEAEKAKEELADREVMLQNQILEMEHTRQTLEQQSSELAGLADELSIAKYEADEAREEVQKAYNTIECDLKAAEEMQRSLLPEEYAHEHGVICSNFYIPSAFLSGDIFNYFLIDEEQFCFYSVDVSGHGVPSALLSVSLANLIRPGMVYREKIALQEKGDFTINKLVTSIVTFLNSRFQMDEATSQYFTISLGILDVSAGKVSICQAGHPSSILLRKSGEVAINSLGGVPIGFLEDADYEAIDYEVNKGDRFYIYTDGITECENKFEEQLGDFRFVKFLEEHSSKPLEEVNRLLQDYLVEWRGGSEFGDDISLIAIEIE